LAIICKFTVGTGRYRLVTVDRYKLVVKHGLMVNR